MFASCIRSVIRKREELHSLGLIRLTTCVPGLCCFLWRDLRHRHTDTWHVRLFVREEEEHGCACVEEVYLEEHSLQARETNFCWRGNGVSCFSSETKFSKPDVLYFLMGFIVIFIRLMSVWSNWLHVYANKTNKYILYIFRIWYHLESKMFLWGHFLVYYQKVSTQHFHKNARIPILRKLRYKVVHP